MSTLTVTAERLTIHEHPNADALELAQVGLYRAVVPKGAYRTGEVALYIPEQAVVPDVLLEELGLVGRLGGKQHNRVCTVRLRGEISQGIVCRPAAIGADLEYAHANQVDFADLLGITKWVPPIPVHMAGEVEAAPDLMPWVDIENIKRYPTIFTAGEAVTVTEKIHGTCCLYTLDVESGAVYVSSKGFGAKKLAIQRNDGNLYWRAVAYWNLDELAKRIADLTDAARVGIFGEVYGAGVQDLSYGADAGKAAPGYAVFDIAVNRGGEVTWLDRAAVEAAVAGPVQLAPLLYEGPYDEAFLLSLAEGATVLGRGAHMREGVVVRPVDERYSEVLGGRAIGKIVSNAYLTRKGGTEYE